MHHSLHLKMAFEKPVWSGKQTRQERRAGEGARKFGFALSQGQVTPQGVFCRMTVTLQHCGNQSREEIFTGFSLGHAIRLPGRRDRSSLFPTPPPRGHKHWGAQGTTSYFACHPLYFPLGL